MELEIRAPNFGSIGHQVTCMGLSQLLTKSVRKKRLSQTISFKLSKRRDKSLTAEATCLDL